MFFMPELSKWMRAKTSPRRVTETAEAAGKETVRVGSERGGKKAAGQLPELVRSNNQRERTGDRQTMCPGEGKYGIH